MAKRVLAIGVGGTGKMVLTILKERLEEAYGGLPDNVVLLSFDTDNLRDQDKFAGTQLASTIVGNRAPEYQPVISPGGMTLSTIFADIVSGKTASYMGWMQHDILNKTLGPAERDIRGGAQQRRQVGRTALFLRYQTPIYQAIVEAISRIYGEPDISEQDVSTIQRERSKRLIFIAGSVAGGTGSGMFIDVANLTRRAIDSNPNWQSVDMAGLIVMPDAFANYTTFMEDPTNLKPNSFAALRELDRFMRVHSSTLPYMVRYGENEQSITWSTNQLLDHVYLVDTASRSGNQDFDLTGDPMKGVFPVVADFIMSHIDNSLGDALATLRSNAGMHYDKELGKMYSSFNAMTYIFPVDDVIESFTYRFLREMVTRQFLPLTDERKKAFIAQEAAKEVEQLFTSNSVLEKSNPTIIQKAIVATRRVDPELPDTSWAGLFGLISITDEQFREHYQRLQDSVEYLESAMVLTKDGDYRNEGFDTGTTRLLNFAENFMDVYLGKQIHPDNLESRVGGQWDAILNTYRQALRVRFANALDAVVLDTLNRRDERKVLRENTLPYAIEIVQDLKNHLRKFKALLQDKWRQLQVDTQLRQLGQGVQDAIAWMNDSRNKRYFAPIFTEPRKAQEAYRSQFIERMQLYLHQRIYNVVLSIVDSLGAEERDGFGELSIVEEALMQLQEWQRGLTEVDQSLRELQRNHSASRESKRAVKTRRYLTDQKYEDELYRQPDHFPAIAQHTLGQRGTEKGFEWQSAPDGAVLTYRMNTSWARNDARGSKQITEEWFAGVKALFYERVRKNVTIAERLYETFQGNPALFVSKVMEVEEPFLRYNPSKNDRTMFSERYVSFNVGGASDERARGFLQNAEQNLAGRGFSVDNSAESPFACTIMQVGRGVRLAAVEPFEQCEPEYRQKVNMGREALHLFPEEQVATEYENSIPTLGQTNNVRRALVPELVIALGDQVKLRSFTLSCAYGLIVPDSYFDPETGEERQELYLTLKNSRRVVLTQSAGIRSREPNFNNLAPLAQEARLYLDALQSLMLKLTEIRGFDSGLVSRALRDLGNRGVSLKGLENPYTLAVTEITGALSAKYASLSPSETDIPDPVMRRKAQAENREKVVETYIRQKLMPYQTETTDPRIKDLTTVMHLVLQQELNSLRMTQRT